jgi:CxxC-x17-CxxC domain-containing protein
MAAAILHFGDDRCPVLPVLSGAGYRVELAPSILHLRSRLEAGNHPGAVSMTDETHPERHQAASLVRSHTTASLILLRNTGRDSFPAIDTDPTEAEFDLIVPRSCAPPDLLRDIAEAIEESSFLRALSRRMLTNSAEVQSGSAQVRLESRLLREDAVRSREASARSRQESQRLLRESARLIGECQSATRLLRAESEVLGSAPCEIGSRDLELTCVDCRAGFVFPAGEQLFFLDKGLQLPTHCPKCRKNRPRAFALTRVLCSRCGASTMVPFKPTQARPVLCRSCFRATPS